MQFYQQILSLVLRIALGITLLIPVADRLGWIGRPGEKNFSLGNWANFVFYTQRLNPSVSAEVAGILAILTTLGEAGFGILLVLGLFTRWAALGTGLLTGAFALAMTIALGYKAPINYSVWVDSAAGLLLATFPAYAYSLDGLIFKRRTTVFF